MNSVWLFLRLFGWLLFVLATNSRWDESMPIESEAGRRMSDNSFVSWNGRSKWRGAVIIVSMQSIDGLPRETDKKTARAITVTSRIVDIVCTRRFELILKESDLCWCLDSANFQMYESPLYIYIYSLFCRVQELARNSYLRFTSFDGDFII